MQEHKPSTSQRESKTRWGTLPKLRSEIESEIKNGRTYKEIAEILNLRHGTRITESAVGSFSKRHLLDRLHPDFIDVNPSK